MPALTDDGSTVTLDLHGARVEEALALARNALRLARQRGRHRLDLIHGASTSDRFGTTPTIKHALHDWLDNRGAAGAQAMRGDATLSLYLGLGQTPDRRRLTLRDVWT